MNIPEGFKRRMINILGAEEAEKLFLSIENEDAVKAFRVNAIKTDIESFEAAKPQIDRQKADFPSYAYITREEYPGSLPCHHSGAIYVQDISAMSTVTATEIREGAIILDSCSAPGGKTTQLAAAAGKSGIVVANEYDKKRCRILQGNVERMGAANTVVCNLDTAVLAELYPALFDLVLCDAPCSGEGMFRKNARAVEEWSEENVKMCAERQREILTNVAKCVKAGGRLLYSTCTFALDENEENVAWFLNTHKDFSLVPVTEELKNHTSDGIMLEDCDIDMTLCRRIYPHRSRGEGQFIALFERSADAESSQNTKKDRKDKRARGNDAARKSRQELDAIDIARRFLAENLTSETCGELVMLGGFVYLVPKIKLPEYNVFTAGVCVGECQKGRMIPHHQLFSALGREFARKVILSGSDEEARRYLAGEEIRVEGLVSSDGKNGNGWAAVLIDGCAVGGVKISGGVAKNHYPKGLRN